MEKQFRIMSFGFCMGPIPYADMVIDVRFLKNPHRDRTLRKLDGRHPLVQAEVLKDKRAQLILTDVVGKATRGEIKSVAFGCSFGKHRSVAFAERLWQMLAQSLGAVVEHRGAIAHATQTNDQA